MAYPAIDHGDGSKDHGLGKCQGCDVFLTGGVGNAYIPGYTDAHGGHHRNYSGTQEVFCPKCGVRVYQKTTSGQYLEGYKLPEGFPFKMKLPDVADQPVVAGGS